MRISDWSSDVCSSDLALIAGDGGAHHRQEDDGKPEGNDDLAKAEGQRLSIAETLKIADVPVLAIFLRRCQAARPYSLGTHRHHRSHMRPRLYRPDERPSHSRGDRAGGCAS